MGVIRLLLVFSSIFRNKSPQVSYKNNNFIYDYFCKYDLFSI